MVLLYKKLSCLLSKDIADKRSRDPEIGIFHESSNECSNSHNKTDCNYNLVLEPKTLYPHSTPEYDREVELTTNGFHKIELFSPLVVAWQAALDNHQDSVPLYQSPKENMAIRGDGKLFKLNM